MASLAFPEELYGGLRVGKLGKSSVKYEIGIFKKDDKTAAAVSFISLAINSELH
jgi:acyl-CoA thioester hydrolase